MDTTFKKVRVINSNNRVLDYSGYMRYNYNKEDRELKTYVEEFLDLKYYMDLDIVVRVLNWVNAQWDHDSMNEAGDISELEILKRAHAGESFRCVEYGKVTAAILNSIGIISREVGLRTIDSDYGGFGRGHVATEVWSNSYCKWLFIDPQFGTYFIKDELPLSYYEIYKLFKQGNDLTSYCKVDSRTVNKHGITKQEYIEGYLEFLSNYTGMIISGCKEDVIRPEMALMLDNEFEIFSFQGGPSTPFLKTSKKEYFYHELNQVSCTLESLKEVPFLEIIKEYNICDNQSYMNNMHRFALQGEFKVRCFNNMPNFSHYEYSDNGSDWKEVDGDQFEYHLVDGNNELRLRAVNVYGVLGIITSINIEYS